MKKFWKIFLCFIMLGLNACASSQTVTTPDINSLQPNEVQVNQAKLQKALTY